MTEQRTRQLMAYAVETHRLRIRKTLLAAIIPLAFMRGVVDAALESQPRWGMVSIVLPGLFWLAYTGVVYHATRRPS